VIESLLYYMKYLVVYYSRTGNTERVGDKIAELVGCEKKKILERKDRSGVLGFMKGGWDALKGKSTEIYSEKEYNDIDHHIIGTPVWANRPCPAVRTYIEMNKEKMDEVSFFCTMGSSGDKKTFQLMQELCGKKPVATLSLEKKKIKEGEFENEVKKFKNKVI